MDSWWTRKGNLKLISELTLVVSKVKPTSFYNIKNVQLWNLVG
jgi:hypothetical protein